MTSTIPSVNDGNRLRAAGANKSQSRTPSPAPSTSRQASSNVSNISSKQGWRACSYTNEIEICIVLRDLDYYFRHEAIRGLKKDTALKVYAYWKPPGALQWVQRCVTETVYYLNCPFVTKMNLRCELADAPIICLKFEVCNTYLNIQSLLGSTEVTLDKLLLCRSRGLILRVPFIVNAITGLCSQSEAGEIFLRGEVLKPCDDALLLHLGCRPQTKRPFHLELSKLNEDSRFEIPQPYTILHRSEEISYDDTKGTWHLILQPISRICNCNPDRVLKLELFERFQQEAFGFALTTLRKLLHEEEREISIIQNKDGKVSRKVTILVFRCSQFIQHPLVYYFKNKGLVLRRIYAVDFSISNWNTKLHGQPLHENTNGRSSYQEGLELTAHVISDFALGDSVFYSYGNPKMQPHVSTFRDEKHFQDILQNYREALCLCKMAACNLTQEDLRNVCGPMGSNSRNGSQLAPLLHDILLSIRVTGDRLEYYSCFIFTDGIILDMDNTMKVILGLAKLPVSLIFIGLGMGTFENLMLLEKDWTHPQTGEYPSRKIVTVIHFRSLHKWESAIKFLDKFHTTPYDIFRKEILTNLDEQAVKFIRTFRTHS